MKSTQGGVNKVVLMPRLLSSSTHGTIDVSLSVVLERSLKLTLTSSQLFLPTLMNRGDSIALTSVVVIIPGSFLSRERAPSHTLFLEPFPTSPLSPLAPQMKFAFEIKTEPVTQAAIIIAVVAFSSGSFAMIVIYAQRPPVSVICLVVLAFIVYLAVRFSPP